MTVTPTTRSSTQKAPLTDLLRTYAKDWLRLIEEAGGVGFRQTIQIEEVANKSMFVPR